MAVIDKLIFVRLCDQHKRQSHRIGRHGLMLIPHLESNYIARPKPSKSGLELRIAVLVWLLINQGPRMIKTGYRVKPFQVDKCGIQDR